SAISFRSSTRQTRTTRHTCAPSATSSATRSTIRGFRSTRRCSTTSSRTRGRAVATMASDRRVALCVARFDDELADRLERGARQALDEGGITEVDRFDVPGAFELPLVAKYAAESGRYDAVICLGAVIRGETDHYDYVCSSAAQGISRVQLDTGVPCGF